MRMFRWIPLLVVFLLATACGGSSPSAPSSTSTTAATNTPAPAVAQLSLTGTWLLGNQPSFTITQNGTAITGTQIFPAIPGVGVVITQTGTVAGTLGGTTSGSALALSMKTTIVTTGTGELAGFAITCVSTDSWVGTATNTTLTGTYTSGTFSCDGLGGIVTAPITGPMNYTKQ